jgi:hypothetical protein
MVGVLINRNYKYTDVELVSGAKVTANMVTVENGKVVRVENGNVTIDNKTFNFSIYNYGMNGDITYNLNNVPANVDGQALVKEFVDFVEKDVA